MAIAGRIQYLNKDLSISTRLASIFTVQQRHQDQRCVLDTNVFVGALLSPGSKPRTVVDLVRRRGTIRLSFASLAELFEVLSRKQFCCYIDEGDFRRFLAVLTREAQRIDVHVEITACRDPKDDKFLSLAVSGLATHILTGDEDLLALHPFQGIQILAPGAFLEQS